MSPSPQTRRAARRAALLAGLFCAAAIAVLLPNHLRQRELGVLESPQLDALRQALRDQPGDPELQDRIRQLDQSLRQEFFARQQTQRTGIWLLASGLVVCAVLWQLAAPQAPPRAGVPARPSPTRVRLTAGALLVAAAALAGAALVAGTRAGPGLAPSHWAQTPDKLATPDEFARNWPQFRGPGLPAGGNAPALPDSWTDKDIIWKVRAPLSGHGSPVVWGDRVFLTGATANRREVYCFAAGDGKLLWTAQVQAREMRNLPPPDVSEFAGYAPATCAADGYRVFAVFPTGEVACFNFDGSPVWLRWLGPLHNSYGSASSPVVFEGRLIVQIDQGDDDRHDSAILAMDVRTGRTLWRTPRPMGSSWASPIVARTPQGPQVITAGKPLAIGYDAIAGKELWRVDCLNGDVVPSPAYAAGLAIVVNAGAAASGIRTDGIGDVTATHVAWTVQEDLPDIASPAVAGELLLMTCGNGTITCRDARDGSLVWRQETDFKCQASPAVVGDRAYVLSDTGELAVIRAGRKYELLGRSSVGEPCNAGPAIAGGRLFIRGEKHLFAIAARYK